MSINYKQLKSFVKEAMFTGGGINEPSAPEGIPHRMGSQRDSDQEQNMGDPEANKLYEVGLVAREAAEELVEVLDDPTYDEAYEFAFKASANLRKALNTIISMGAHPMPSQRVVAQPQNQQRYNAQGTQAGNYFGGGANIFSMPAGLREEVGEPIGLGPAAESVIHTLSNIKDPEEARAISNWLIGSDQFPDLTKKEST